MEKPLDRKGTAQNAGAGQLKEIDGWTDRNPRLLGSIWHGAFRGPLQLHKDLCALARHTEGLRQQHQRKTE